MKGFYEKKYQIYSVELKGEKILLFSNRQHSDYIIEYDYNKFMELLEKQHNITDIDELKYYNHFEITIHDKEIVDINIARIEKNNILVKYYEKDYNDIEYLDYHQFGFKAQRDGITTICGMSGAGKTWNALQMLYEFASNFDKILYLNYELTERDVITRYCKEVVMHDVKRKQVLDKLYIANGILTTMNLKKIFKMADVKDNETCAIIVDNLDSIVGQGDDTWKVQMAFIKELDTATKSGGHHALVLVQPIKNTTINDIFNTRDNCKDVDLIGTIKDSVSVDKVAGSISLAHLSRSVLFVGSYQENGVWYYQNKILKRGTGKSETVII